MIRLRKKTIKFNPTIVSYILSMKAYLITWNVYARRLDVFST